jgi:hypothetical protein
MFPVTVAVAGLGAGLVVLALLGGVSWRRTGPIRRGELDRGLRGRGGHDVGGSRVPTSIVTWVPAVVGSCWVGGALAGTITTFARGGSPPIDAVLVRAIGLGVAASGVVARVARVQLTPAGLVVEHTGRAPFVASWDRMAALSPPRWFMGAWTLYATPPAGPDRGVEPIRCRLMPSDLWGHETVLVSVVREAGLRRLGRTWVRLEDAHAGAPRAGGRSVDAI